MVLKPLLWFFVGLVACVWAWEQRHAPWVDELRRQWEPQQAARIQFDNGTVREPPLPASGVAEQAPGMKKCVGAGKTIYTDGYCPAGTSVAAIKNGTVNVLSLKPAPKPDSASVTTAPAQRTAILPWLAASGGGALPQPSIQERRMDAAVNR